MGRVAAFEIHGPAAVGLMGVPGDKVEFAFSADDGLVWFHGSGSVMVVMFVLLYPNRWGAIKTHFQVCE